MCSLPEWKYVFSLLATREGCVLSLSGIIILFVFFFQREMCSFYFTGVVIPKYSLLGEICFLFDWNSESEIPCERKHGFLLGLPEY